MTVQQHFWDIFFAWCLVLAFVVVIGAFFATCGYFASDSHKRRQLHKHQLEVMKMEAGIHAAYIKAGVDADYVKFLEDKAGG